MSISPFSNSPSCRWGSTSSQTPSLGESVSVRENSPVPKSSAGNADELFAQLEDLSKRGEPMERRMKIAQLIATRGRDAVARLSRTYPTYDLHQAPVAERFALFHQIIESSQEGAILLLQSLYHLGLDESSPEQRLELCEKFAKHNFWVQTSLLSRLPYFQLEMAPKERSFQLCLQLAEGAPDPTPLINLLPMFPFSEEQCYQLFQAAVTQSSKCWGLLKSLPNLNLSLEYRLKLLQDVMRLSAEKAYTLVQNLDCFQFSEMPVSTRLDTFRTLLDLWPEKRPGFISLLKDFNFAEASLEDCRSLLETICSFGGRTAASLAYEPGALKIDCMDLETRLQILQRIHDDCGAYDLIKSPLMKSILQDIRDSQDVHQRLAMFRRMVQDLPLMAVALCKDASSFGLDQASLEERLGLAAVALTVEANAEATLAFIDTLGILSTIAASDSSQERRALCDKIMSHHEIWVCYLAARLPALKLSESDYVALIDSLLQGWGFSAEMIVKHYLNLGLSPENCRKIALKLAPQSECSAAAILKTMDYFLSLGDSADDLYELYRLCVQHQEAYPISVFLSSLDRLKVSELSVEKRLELAKLCFVSSSSGAKPDCQSLLQLIEGASASDRFRIYQGIVRGNAKAFLTLFQYNGYKGLSDLSSDAVLELHLYNIQCHPEVEDWVDTTIALLKDRSLSEDQKGRLLIESARASCNWGAYGNTYKLIKLIRGCGVAETTRFLLLGSPKLEKWKYHRVLQKEKEQFPAVNFDTTLDLINKTLPPTIVQAIKEAEASINKMLCRWALYATGLLQCMDEERRHLLLQSGVLEIILEYRNPEQRYVLIREASKLTTEQLQLLCAEKPKWSKLSWILLARLTACGFDHGWALACLGEIRGQRMFRDSARIQELLSFLQSLLHKTPLSPSQIQAAEQGFLGLLSKASQSTARQHANALSSGLTTLDNIATLLGEEALFSCMASQLTPQAFFSQHLSKLFDLEDVPDLMQKFDATFGRFRDQSALFTYLSSVKKLYSSDGERALKALQLYVRSVVTGTFHETRYDPERSPHLKELFSRDPSLEQSWRQAWRPQALSVDGLKEEAQPDYRQIFRSKILTDGHLPAHTEYSRLITYLEDGTVLPAPEGDDPKERFQTLLIGLCTGKIALETFGQRCSQLDLHLGELKNDIEALFATESSDGLMISESDRPDDLLLLGTEIRGSCQRVNGSPDLNKCLLGYLLNGEIRAVTVKKDDRLVARAVLRLMWDPEADKAVILQERTYNNLCENRQVATAIDRWAVAKAARMGLALVAATRERSGEAHQPYNGTLHFYGGLSPFIYSDAASGGVQAHPFQLKELRTLYKPEGCPAASSS